MTGFVKLYRSVTKTAIANNPEYFAAWIHLLCMATHTEHDQVVGRIVVNLLPGQLVFGRKKFSVETGVSENKVRAALDVMKQLQMITIKSHAKFSVISILNWDKYHGRSPANNQKTASFQPAHSQHPATNKKGEEEIKNGKNVLTSMSPQADDVTNVFEYWRMRMGKNQSAKLSAKRKRSVQARLNEGRSIDDIKQAIDGCASSPFHMGQGPKSDGTVYDDLELICRSSEKIEHFMQLWEKRDRINANPEVATANLGDKSW